MPIAFSYINSLKDYRGFISSSIHNEFRSKFSRSKLGTFWIVLHPLAMVAIYSTVLSEVLAARLGGVDNRFGYAMFLLAGILCWTLFAEIVQRCLSVLIDNAGLIKKMSFPRVALPAISVGSAMIAYAAMALVVAIAMPLLGFRLTANLLWLPAVTVVVTMFAVGLGVILGTLNVFIRDLGQVVPIGLQLWFWITPIIYPLEVAPKAFQRFAAFNPVTPMVQSYQNIIVYGTPPPSALVWVAVLAICLVITGIHIFRRASADLADVL